MPGYLIVHDKRLLGSTPRTHPFYQCSEATTLLHCLQSVSSYARERGGISELQILCRGDFADGEYRLEVCREGLSAANVSLTAKWRGLIKRIVLCVCDGGVPAMEGAVERICSELAHWSGAEVIASNAPQHYKRIRTRAEVEAGANAIGTIELGPWRGVVQRFDPETGGANRIY
ncbi:MAG: hypothetical protein HYZ37_18095 [Candidatus Solibacter usitatus]|nr:hypothetical protein [Candidatus Solibacter usitatus]